jgi:hypothetical protein
METSTTMKATSATVTTMLGKSRLRPIGKRNTCDD